MDAGALEPLRTDCKEELSQVPALIKYEQFIQNRYLQAPNIRQAAEPNNLKAIQKGYLKKAIVQPAQKVLDSSAFERFPKCGNSVHREIDASGRGCMVGMQ
jgi:hypothetical protein